MLTCKRSLSNSSLVGDPPDPLISKLPNANHKKVKVDHPSEQDSPLIIIEPVHADLHSAITIKKALDCIHKLPLLGYCPTKEKQFYDKFQVKPVPDHIRFRLVRSSSPSTSEEEEEEEEKRLAGSEFLNKTIIELKTVYKDVESLSVSHAYGSSEIHSFLLRITRPGCEYDGTVEHNSKEIVTLLPTWFEHSAISEYEDTVQSKVVKTRNAREIPASEFQVKPEFLGQIQDLWKEHFFPRNVYAEPYKIYLYRCGGPFKPYHSNTPETGLVGTFLVGLGDTSSTPEGNFLIADKRLKANPCSWVAFHPDIPHKITKQKDGYRAMMVFKIFRVSDNEDVVVPAQLEARVTSILDQIPTPFGLFMTHKYSIGTTSLNEFDGLLSAYARSRKNTKARMFPVVTKFRGEVFDDHLDSSDEKYETFAESRVYPFTAAHVNILLEKNVDQAEKQVQWLSGLSRIPFYTWDINACLETWQEDYSDWTRNGVNSRREDSIYLSYAILFLPKRWFRV